jgi:hypothetical protein
LSWQVGLFKYDEKEETVDYVGEGSPEIYKYKTHCHICKQELDYIDPFPVMFYKGKPFIHQYASRHWLSMMFSKKFGVLIGRRHIDKAAYCHGIFLKLK